MGKGIGTETERRAFKVLGTKCSTSPAGRCCTPVWDGMTISIPIGREKPLFCCIVMMSKERCLGHVCDFSRAEASYKESYYLCTSRTAWNSELAFSEAFEIWNLAVIPLGRIMISAHLWFYL